MYSKNSQSLLLVIDAFIVRLSRVFPQGIITTSSCLSQSKLKRGSAIPKPPLSASSLFDSLLSSSETLFRRRANETQARASRTSRAVPACSALLMI